MDPTRWRAATEIFYAALEQATSERTNFISRASNGDELVEAEVRRLLAADAEASEYLDEPAAPFDDFGVLMAVPPLVPGDVLKHRFEIIRPVGYGGMGHVFEAYDLDLRVRVALKVIRPEIATQSEMLEFFRREVRTARAITHSNVCRTYDFDRGTVDSGDPKREFCFLTMEFLEGETLSSRLRRNGPLTLVDALAVARQVASALDSAHAAGVIHRDIKPGNIMLVPATEEFRAVIMDFGLARIRSKYSVRGSSPSIGGLAGTLAYMAPEQWEIGAAVSPATDVYAFGLVLYESITGKPAYPSDGLLAGIAERVKGSTPSPRSIVPAIPDCWESAIRACLCFQPVDRFQSAGDVVRALEGSVTSHPHPRSLRVTQIATLKRIPRPATYISATFLIVVSLLAAWLRFHHQSDQKATPGALVYLAPVSNHSDTREFDTITELLQAGLSQSAQINILDEVRVGATLRQMIKPPNTQITEPLAREIAMRAGAARVIVASVDGSAGSYHLNVDVQQPDNTPDHYRAHWSNVYSWRSGSKDSRIPAELLTAIRNATDWIRLQIGESNDDIARFNAAPDDVTTGSWEALQDYVSADSLSGSWKKDDAIEYLKKAVAIDSGFALAFGRLGDIYVSLGRSGDGYQAYRQALRGDFDRRLSRRELDRIRGNYALDSWDYSAAEEAFHDYTVFFPYDYRGWFYRAQPLIRLGRLDEAEATLRRVEKVYSDNPFSPLDLAWCALERRDSAASEQWISALKKRNNPDGAHLAEGSAKFITGDHAGALREFSALEHSESHGFRVYGYLLEARGRLADSDLSGATTAVGAGLSEARAQGNTAMQARFLDDEGSLLCLKRDFDRCAETIEAAITLDDSPELLIQAGDILGTAIGKAEPQPRLHLSAMLHRVESRVPSQPGNRADDVARARLRAEELAAAGRHSTALAESRTADVNDQEHRLHWQTMRFAAITHASQDLAHPEPGGSLTDPPDVLLRLWLTPTSYALQHFSAAAISKVTNRAGSLPSSTGSTATTIVTKAASEIR